MKRSRVNSVVLGILLCALVASDVRAELFVFGDSLSDVGNFSKITEGKLPPTPLYRPRKFTNGPVWIEYLAEALGEPIPNCSMEGGTNYACNGSRVAGFSLYGTPNVRLQVATCLSEKGPRLDSDDYFVIWAGANDLFFGPVMRETKYVDKAVEGIVKSIEALHAAGARKLIVLNLPPLGQTPYIQADPLAVPELNAASIGFNRALASALVELEQRHAEILIAHVDICGLFQDMTDHPLEFRLSNTHKASTLFDANSGISLGYALNTEVDPDGCLFWDGVHPTTRVHEAIGKLAHHVVISKNQ